MTDTRAARLCRGATAKGRIPHGSGFTLIELLIVVVILGVLAAVVIPRFVVQSESAKKRACFQNKAIINDQVERWHFEKGYWPADDLSDIGADPAYFPNGIPRCPVKNTL